MPRRPVTLTPKKPRKPVETDEPKRRRVSPRDIGRREKKKNMRVQALKENFRTDRLVHLTQS